mgnify:CR=1 FL=1
MQFGVSTWLWQSGLDAEDLRRLAPEVAGMGFDLIEIPIDEPDQMDWDEAATICDELGLEMSTCAAIGPGRDLIHEDAEVVENGMAYVRDCVDIAERVGAPNVMGPLYSSVGRCWAQTDAERERDLQALAGRLRRLADYAAEREVTLCVEPLNRFETSFINTTEQALELIDRVDHPACRLILDLFHMGIEEKSMGGAIRSAGPHLRHLHVSENDRGTPGTGQFRWEEIAAALGEVDYEGPVVIETFSQQNETLARAASIWRPLAESPEAMAEDGLRFLRGLLEE